MISTDISSESTTIRIVATCGPECSLHTYSMDQGVAAVVAGIVGMVGALGGAVAGGYAAVRGARIGAENAAEVTRQQVKDQAAATHAQWLTDLRREKYSALVRTSVAFAMQIGPLVSFESRRDDPSSQLNEVRRSYFDQLYEARFLAGRELQQAIDQAADLAENVGHEPYDNPGERTDYRHRLHRQGFERARAIEDAARAELGLPPSERTRR
ncbi:hypothetical protein [Streptomyces chartreusis]|uniref:hypothetical protein n=1 Tax=Streptomyces chartreusis TaxID=1969 RepID=UPI003814B916